MNKSDMIKERLQAVMLSDRQNDIERLLSILKCEITMTLQSYMEIETEDVSISFEVLENGIFEFHIDAVTPSIIAPGKMID